MAASFEQGKINAEIILKLDSLTTGINQANAKINTFSRRVARDSQANSKAMSAAWAAGFAIISVAAIKAAKKVTAAFKAMISTYAEFEQSLANTQSVARASTEELDAMEKAARRVGATTRSTASDAANALYYLASAGFSARESIDALDGVNALAIATQSDLARTSETVATTIRQYGLETDAATDIANTFTAAITNSLATMDKLAKSFEYVGPIAAGLGITVEETTGALQLLYNKGFSGEKAGRGLRSILVDLADSTSVVNKKLGEMGIAFDDVNPATNELADIFDHLRENEVDATNAAAIFGKVSGVQLASLISVASNAEGGMDELTEAVTGTNRAFEAMEIQMDTLKGSMDKFKNAEEALKISVGKELDPALTELVDTATRLLLVVDRLPKPLLAAAAIIGTIAAVATLASVALVGLKLALASAVVAPVIAAIAGLSVPLTILGVAVVGVAAGMAEINKTSIQHAIDDFGQLATEMGATEATMVKMVVTLKDVDEQLFRMGIVGHESTETLREAFENLSEESGLTLKQIIKLSQANEDFAATTGDVVDRLEKVILAEEMYRALSVLSYNERINASLEYADILRREQALAKEGADSTEKQSTLAQDSAEALRVAFKRANELQILLGDEFDRSTYLTNIFNDSLKDMVDSGMLATDEAILNQIQLWEDLQKKHGEVTSGELTDKEKLIAAHDRLLVRLRENEQRAILAGETNTTYNKSLEDSQAVLDTINGLVEERFNIEGTGIQFILDNYGGLIQGDEARISLLQEYLDKLRDLSETELERIDREHLAATEKSAGDKEALIAIHDYYDALRAIAKLEQDEKKIVVLKDYADELKKLGEDQKDAIERERKAENDHIDNLLATGQITEDVWKKAKEDIKAYYDVLSNRAVWEDIAELTQTYGGLVEDILTSIVDYSGAVANARIAEEQRVYDETTRLRNAYYDEEFQRLEDEKNAALIAAGIVEDDSRQRLETALEQAKLSGDLLTVQRAEEALARFDILEDYENKKEALASAKAEEEEAREKALAEKIAKISYDQAVADWNLGKLSILLNGAIAAMQAMSTGNYVIAAGMGAVTAFQYAKAEEARPVKPPTFADGGVVPGSSYKGDITPILANAGELILNKAQQDNVANQLGDDRSIHITTNLLLDGKVVAVSSAKYYRNGQVKL